jgi:hypothetical protein
VQGPNQQQKEPPSLYLGSRSKSLHSRQDACSTVCVTHRFGSATPRIISELSHRDAPWTRVRDLQMLPCPRLRNSQPAFDQLHHAVPFKSLILEELERHLSFGLVVQHLVYLSLYSSQSHPLSSVTVPGRETARRLHASSCRTLPQYGGHGIRSGKLELSSNMVCSYLGISIRRTQIRAISVLSLASSSVLFISAILI